MDAREPGNVTELRSFPGLANHSSRFIPHFATISEPLRRLTKKDTPSVFGSEHKAAFQALKQSITEAGTLASFDKTAPTKVVKDARPIGLGCVLLQKREGQWTQIHYASRIRQKKSQPPMRN